VRRAAIALVLTALMAAAAGAASTSAAAGYAIASFVIANGGTAAGASGVGVQGTAGQLATGSSSGSGGILLHGFWSFRGAPVLGVGPLGADALPSRPMLGPARPNPVRGEVTFDVALPHAAAAALEVYDLAGRKLGASPVVSLAAGRHPLTCSALDAVGARPGLYYARLLVDGRAVAAQRMVLVR